MIGRVNKPISWVSCFIINKIKQQYQHHMQSIY